MTSHCSGSELVAVLAQRRGLIETLATEPATQAELANRADVSRPTAHRAINQLEDFGLVRATDSRYELTEFGHEALNQHQAHLDTLDRLCRLSVPRQQIDPDLSLRSPILDGSDVSLSQQFAIDSASHSNKEIIENAVRVYTVLDGFTVNYFTGHLDRVVTEEVVMIVSDTHLDGLLATYRKPIKELFDTDYFKLYRTEEPIPYSVTVAETEDQTYAILLTHADGQVKASVRNHSPEAVAWARERFDHYYDSAIRVDQSQVQ